MILYCARHLLPIDSPGIEDGALLVDGRRVIAVGLRRDLAAAHPGIQIVDFGDAVILPPLVNAHTHLELTDFPDWSAAVGEGGDGDFADWILNLVRVRRTVGVDAARLSLQNGLRQSLSAGTGAIGDILTTLDLTEAYRGSPLAGRVFVEVLGIDPSAVATRLAAISGHLSAPPTPSLGWGLSPHAPYTLNRDTFAQALKFADERRLPLATHWAETAGERGFLSGGPGILQRLYTTVGWPLPPDPPAVGQSSGLVVHGVHLRSDEIDALARAGSTVILCPRSNSAFGDARAPVAALRQAGVPLAIGTDSRASCPSLSVWDELAFARTWFSGTLDPDEWLAIATSGGSKALGMEGRMGRLAIGHPADFQVVALPPEATSANLSEALCSAGSGIELRALCLAGENVLPLPSALPIMTPPVS